MSWRWAAVALAAASCATAQRSAEVRRPEPEVRRAPDARFVRYPPSELAGVKNAHDYRGKPVCQSCHPSDTEALLAGPIHTCERCHPKANHTPGHQSGTRLDPKRVGGLPLPNSLVVCHTCHDPHDVRRNPHGLRLPVNALCLSCHAKH